MDDFGGQGHGVLALVSMPVEHILQPFGERERSAAPCGG